MPPLSNQMIEDLAKRIWGGISNIPNAGQRVWGANPDDFLGAIAQQLREGLGHTGAVLEGGYGSDSKPSPKPQAKEQAPYSPPTDSTGDSPQNYQLWQQGPDYKAFIAAHPKADQSMSTDDYAKLVAAARKGDKDAKEIIRSYRPTYPPTTNQVEQSLTAPYVKALQGLGAMEGPAEGAAAAATPSWPQAQAQMGQVSSGLTGLAPPTESPTVAQEGSEYASAVAPYESEIGAIQTQSDQDLGQAAATSQKTYPYEAMIQDLLGRYAYSLESPYLQPTVPSKGTYLPPWMQTLITAAAGVNSSGSGPINVGTMPGQSPPTTSSGAGVLQDETATQIANQIQNGAGGSSAPNLGPSGALSNPAGG